MKTAKKFASLTAGLCLAFNAVGCTTVTSPADAHTPLNNTIAAQTEAAATTSQDTLQFYNLHTNERITIRHNDGQSVSREANWFMRDFRRGEPAQMDSKLFDLLGDLKDAIQARHPGMNVEFHVISGYRSPATNNGLRESGGSQAQSSLHMHGQAIDIRVPGLSTRELRDIATCLQAGGVGYYPSDDFIHVDTGRVRYWPSRDYLSNLKCN